MPDDGQLLVMRDMMDAQLETSDGWRIGRVDDIEAEEQPDGSLVLTHLVVGPQALMRRTQQHLAPVAHFILRDRFDHHIPIAEAESVGPTIRLRGDAEQYGPGKPDRWLARHLIRFIPWSGGR